MSSSDPPEVPLFRVKNWDRHFENNRTRNLKTMAWLPLPTDTTSDGYTDLISRPAGILHFACWITALQVSANCVPRGTLLRSSGTPHTFESLARKTRIPAESYREAFPILVEIGWLECVEAAVIPQQGAAEVRRDCGDGASTLHYITSHHIQDAREGGGGPEDGEKPRLEPRSPDAAPSEWKSPELWGPDLLKCWWNEHAGFWQVPAVTRITSTMLGMWRDRLREFGSEVILEKLPEVLARRPERWKVAMLPNFTSIFESEDKLRQVIDGERYQTPDLDDLAELTKAKTAEAAERSRTRRQAAEAKAARKQAVENPSLSREELGRRAAQIAAGIGRNAQEGPQSTIQCEPIPTQGVDTKKPPGEGLDVKGLKLKAMKDQKTGKPPEMDLDPMSESQLLAKKAEVAETLRRLQEQPRKTVGGV